MLIPSERNPTCDLLRRRKTRSQKRIEAVLAKRFNSLRRETPTQFQGVNQPLRTAAARASHLQSGLVPNSHPFSAGEWCRNLRRSLHRCQFGPAQTRRGSIDRCEFGGLPTRTLPSISDRFWAKSAASRRIYRCRHRQQEDDTPSCGRLVHPPAVWQSSNSQRSK